MNREEELLIHILKLLLHENNTLPHDLIFPEINYDKLYRIANNNSVANMAAFLLNHCDDIPPDVKTKFDHQRLAIIMQQLKSEKALSECCDLLKEAHVKGIVLKGTILKNMYPDSFMRSMSDIDIYMEEDDIGSICALLVREGFSTGVIGLGNHYEFLKYGVAKIEFHPELVALDSPYGTQVFLKKVLSRAPIAQVMNIWEHTEPFNGNEYIRQLTPEYHYLYIIMHMMNHFLSAGTGIRSIVDVWIMNRHYAKEWNRKDIESLLEEYGLLKFEKYVLALADKWFDLTGIPYLPIDYDNDVLDSLESYILGSGTYGTAEQTTYRLMGYESGTTSKVRYFTSRFFLPCETLKDSYPILEKYPVLLPAIWVKRGIDAFQKRGKSTSYKMKVAMNVDQKKMDQQKALIEAMVSRDAKNEKNVS